MTRSPFKIIIILLLSLILTACSPDSRSDSLIVYGLSLTPSGIDPHIHASSELGIPLRSVYDSLVYRDPMTGNFVPGLAKSWQVSEDGLVYTFALRDDVIFHDGTPFNAEAVRINLERIMDPATNSLKARDLLGSLKSIEIHTPQSLSLILGSPFEPFLDGLSQPYLGIASPAALALYDTATYQFHQVGTGPYRFVEYSVNDYLLLEENPDYTWGPHFLENPGPPAIKNIEFRFFTDAGSRTLALQAGEADIMGELLPVDAASLSNQGLITLVPSSILGQPLQLILNTNRIPTNDPAVRKALIYATDRLAIAKIVFQGYSQPAYSPLTSSTPYHDPNLESLYIYDPVQATILLDSTGWLDSDGDGWRDQEGIPLEIILIIPPWNQLPDVAELVKQQWESSLKIHVMIKQVASFPMLVEAANTGVYNGIALNFSGVDPAILNSFFLMNNRLNWSRGGSPELDALLIQSQGENDPVRRADLYSSIQRMIMEEALILPLIEPTNLNGVNPTVSGLHFDFSGWFPFLVDLKLSQSGS